MDATPSQSSLGRKSSLFAGSQRVIEASSQVGYADAPGSVSTQNRQRPRTPLENTFKMSPDKKFEVKPIEVIINKVLQDQLEEEKYDPKSSKQMTKTLSTIITNRVKALGYDRYKIVTIVTVGEIANHGVRIASRCLMDQDTDNYASGSFKNSSLFGCATVFGMYYE